MKKLLSKSKSFLIIALFVTLAMMGYVHEQSRYVERDITWMNINRDVVAHVAELRFMARQNEFGLETLTYREVLRQQIDHVMTDISLLARGGVVVEYEVEPVSGPLREQVLSLESDMEVWHKQVLALWNTEDPEEIRKLRHEVEINGLGVTNKLNTIHTNILELTRKRRVVADYGTEAMVAGYGFILLVAVLSIGAYSRKLEWANDELSDTLYELKMQKHALDGHAIVAVTDLHGIIISANDKFCSISEYTREELIGSSHVILNSGYHSKEFFKDMWQTISSGKTWEGEILNRAKSGRLYWVNTTIVPHLGKDGKPEKYVAIRSDITKRKEYESALYESERRMAKQNRVLRKLATYDAPGGLESFARVFTEVIAQTLVVGRVGLWMLDDSGEKMVCRDMYDLTRLAHLMDIDISIEDNRSFISALETSQLVSIQEVAVDARSLSLNKHYAEQYGVCSLLAAGIQVGGKMVGMVTLEEVGQERRWKLDEHNFAASIVDFVAIKIEEEERNQVEEALRVVAKITPHDEEEQFFVELARQVAAALGSGLVVISSLSKSHNAVVTIAAYGQAPIEQRALVSLDEESPSAQVIRDAATFMAENLETSHPLLSEGRAVLTRHYLEVPMFDSAGHVIGTIIAINKRPTMAVSMAESMLKICATRVSAELERVHDQDRMQSIVDTISDIIWEVDPEGVISYCSENLKKLLHYEAEEVIGRNIREFFDPDEALRYSDLIAEQVHLREPIKNLEYSLVDRYGRRVYFLYNAIPLFDANKELTGYHGISTDITQLKQTEARTRMMAAAVDQSLEGFLITDVEGVVEYANPAYMRITGLTADHVYGNNVFDIGVLSGDDDALETFKQAIVDKQAFSRYMQGTRKDGSRFEQEFVFTPILDEREDMVNGVISIRDVTQEAMLEQQARQSQKLQAIGTLAGGIAHDFNNILSAILGYSDLTLEDLEEDSLARDNLVQVINAANRAKELVQQILAFSRQNGHAPQLLAPQLLTKEVLRLLRATIPAMIELNGMLEAEGVNIRMDPSQYHQLVMNLVVNAGQAIGERQGVIEVELKPCHVDESEAAGLGIEVGEYAYLRISDTGCGMTPEVKERVFEPFFTTKSVDEGTGMGLSAVHGIVTSAHGGIRLTSEPDEGTTFEVYLPMVVEVTEAEEEQVCMLHTGSEHLLIVDDEEIQMAVMTKMLDRMGYSVTACGSSTEALARFAKDPSAFDGVITDVNMPSLSGDMLARKLLELRPDLPIIMCTGYSEQVGPEEARRIGVREYIRKPIMTQDLDEALSRIFTKGNAA